MPVELISSLEVGNQVSSWANLDHSLPPFQQLIEGFSPEYFAWTYEAFTSGFED